MNRPTISSSEYSQESVYISMQPARKLNVEAPEIESRLARPLRNTHCFSYHVLKRHPGVVNLVNYQIGEVK